MSRLLILGAGVSGLAAARLARSRGMSATVYSRDDTSAAMEQGFAVASGEWDPVLLHGVDLVLVSPGFSERSMPVVEALESGLPVWSEIEFAWRHLDQPVAAVTGTNGKTTVTEATSSMLEASGVRAPASGNIGTALSDQVDIDCEILVVEVSSFQLRFTETFHPAAAVVTNVAVDHLDWHGSEHSYRSAKARIFANQTGSDLLIYDVDDPGARALVADAPSELFPVSAHRLPPDGGGVDSGHLVVGDLKIDLAGLASTAPAHLSNLACSAALALRMGASVQGVESVATTFSAGAHRRQVISTHGGILWINDSKATNPHAALASIRAHESVILIAGGLAKGLDVTALAGEPNVRRVIGIGSSGPALAEAAGERGVLAGTLETAIEIADEVANRGDVVLLAPGCASFDQFVSYGERGDRFAELVSRLEEGGAEE